MWFYSTNIATICEENGSTRFVFNLLALMQNSRSSNAFILVRYLYQIEPHRQESWHERKSKINKAN